MIYEYASIKNIKFRIGFLAFLLLGLAGVAVFCVYMAFTTHLFFIIPALICVAVMVLMYLDGSRDLKEEYACYQSAQDWQDKQDAIMDKYERMIAEGQLGLKYEL